MFIECKKYSGDMEILDEGSLFSFEPNHVLFLKFNLKSSQDSIGFKFSFMIEFIKDETNEKKFTTQLLEQDNTIKLNLFNFDNSLGAGNTIPIEFGQFAGKKLYLRFWCYKASNIGFKFDYYLFWGIKNER